MLNLFVAVPVLFQILPFLAVGLGVDDVFLIAHTFKLHAYKSNIDYLVSIISRFVMGFLGC